MKSGGLKAAPAFQDYAADMLADSRFAMMSAAAVGVFYRLKLQAWLDGSVPADVKAVARLVREDAAVVSAIWPEVLPMFEELDGRLIYPPHEEQRAKHAAWRDKSRQGGLASGEARRTKGASTTVQPI